MGVITWIVKYFEAKTCCRNKQRNSKLKKSIEEISLLANQESSFHLKKIKTFSHYAQFLTWDSWITSLQTGSSCQQTYQLESPIVCLFVLLSEERQVFNVNALNT
jgi:hypothetical protein